MLRKLQTPPSEAVFDVSRYLYHDGQTRATKQVVVER
jgi:hypothetical protein